MANAKMEVREEELLLSVADVLLIDLDTKMEYATASLKSHNISQTVDTSEIRAGRSNAVVATLESNKTITVEIEDVHSNRDWIAIAMDANVEDNATATIRVLPQTLKVENGKVKLSRVPAAEIQGYNKSKDNAVVKISVDGSVDGTAQNGDIILVESYDVTVAAEQIKIGGEGAGRAFAMYLEESVFNNNMKVIATKTTYFPRVVPESSFTMSGSSELAEQNMTYTFTVAQPEGEKELGHIFYVPVADAAKANE